MTDARTETPADDDADRLPWLEAVEEEDTGDGPSAAKLIALVVIGLVAIGVIVGGLFWIGSRAGESGNGDLIAAPEGDYKVKPGDPGGMRVEGEGDTAFAASEGAEPKGRISTERLPEAPVTRGPPQPKQQTPPAGTQRQPQPKAQTPPARPAAQPTPAPASGPTIQLGAFSSQASANRAWTALSGRFRYLSPLSHNVVSVHSGGRTLYRLRARGADAASVCRRLQVAGESCVVVD